jgi:hypothetical protein
MKKLLALILCVVMVMSLAPAAFAAGTTGGIAVDTSGTYRPKWQDKSTSATAIKNLKKDITAMYTAIAADEFVFGTAQALHDLTDGLAKNLFADTESIKYLGTTFYQTELVDNTRAYLKQIIGNEISNYVNARYDLWTDSNGYVKPDKYIEVFAKAATNAVSSSKAQKAIEAFMYGVIATTTQASVNDKADDLYDRIKDWGTDNWEEFGNAGSWVLKEPDFTGSYATGWLPEMDILVPTGSWAAASDASDSGAYGMFYGASHGYVTYDDDPIIEPVPYEFFE